MGDSATMEEDSLIPAETDDDEIDWVIVKTLLDANARTTQALEHHLLRTYYQENPPDVQQMQACIERAIDDHQRIVNDLEATFEALDELASD